MTNQEAIEKIEQHMRIHFASEYPHAVYITEALNLAIEALEKQDVTKETKRWNTCETMCRHAPPSNKWPCVDCDMRYHDRAEPPKEKA